MEFVYRFDMPNFYTFWQNWLHIEPCLLTVISHHEIFQIIRIFLHTKDNLIYSFIQNKQLFKIDQTFLCNFASHVAVFLKSFGVRGRGKLFRQPELRVLSIAKKREIAFPIFWHCPFSLSDL
jgi:hypothetical protein